MSAHTTHEALKYMAGRCNYASTEDGVGFNKFDADFGHSLAMAETLTPNQERAALKMLRKYRVQLSTAPITRPDGNRGFDFPELVRDYSTRHGQNGTNPQPAGVTQPLAPQPRNRIEVVGENYVIFYKFDTSILEAIRRLPERHWDGDKKVWTVPTRHAVDVQQFARRFHFAMPSGGSPTAPAPQPVIVEEPRKIDWDGENFVITWPFGDMYFGQLQSAVRDIPGRRWAADRRAWTAPRRSCLDVEELSQKYTFVITHDATVAILAGKQEAIEERARIEALIAASKASHSDTDLGLNISLRPFQVAGVEYAMERRRTFIADEMGLGKTRQALAVLKAEFAYPALIVCPKSVVPAWMKEIAECTPECSVQVLTTTSGFETVLPDITLIHYDAVIKRQEDLENCFEALVLDESHKIKSRKAQRTKAIRAIAETLTNPDPIILCLSGTALVNRPGELVTQLSVQRRLEDFGGFKRYWGRFCNHSERGAANLEELNVELRTNCMVRRLKKDVLKELPPKVWADLPVPLENETEYRFAERDFISWVKMAYAGNHGKIDSAIRGEQLARLTALRGLAARGKIKAGVEWCRDFLEDNGKLIVFAHHKPVQEALLEGLRDFNPRAIRSEMDIDARQKAVEDFQEDDSVRVIVCSLLAGSEGITLTAASNVCFLELAWTPANMDQAADRAHRIGQLDSVTAWQLVAPNSIDVYMSEILAEKRDIISRVLDGKAVDAEEASQSIQQELVDRMVFSGGNY